MKKYKVMLVSGGFDPVHKGHLEMIEKAEEMADEVWVILNNEHWLQQKKGKSFMPEKEREYIMSRIKGVTKTFICNPRIQQTNLVCDGIYSLVMTYRREYDDEHLWHLEMVVIEEKVMYQRKTIVILWE